MSRPQLLLDDDSFAEPIEIDGYSSPFRPGQYHDEDGRTNHCVEDSLGRWLIDWISNRDQAQRVSDRLNGRLR